VLTDGLASAGRALFPLNATTLALSLAGHLIYGRSWVPGCGHHKSVPGEMCHERPRSPPVLPFRADWLNNTPDHPGAAHPVNLR
jgi:hypothetical protein